MKTGFTKAAIAACALFMLGAHAASACPVLKKADPRVGATVQAAPADLTLRFSGPIILEQSTLTVTGPDGRVVSHGTLRHPGDDDDSVAVAMDAAASGKYKVRWTLICNCEGSDHTAMPGDFSFTVSP